MSLEDDYQSLLQEHGLSLDTRVLTSDNHKELMELYKSASKEFAEQRGLDWNEESSISYQQIKGIVENLGKQKKSLWELKAEQLKQLQNSVEEILKNSGIKLDVPVLVAQFPTGTVNAQVVKVPSGMLILVNDGIFTLIERLAKYIWTSYMEEREASNPEELAKENSLLLIDIAVSYLLSSDMKLSPKFPPAPTNLVEIIGGYIMGTERFVLAHEYAHIINGDLNQNSFEKIPTLAGDLEVYRKSWDMELRADLLAAKILLDDYRRFKNNSIKDLQIRNPMISKDRIEEHEHSTEFYFQGLFAGPLFFFSASHLIETFSHVLLDIPDDEPEFMHIQSHPPSLMRYIKTFELCSEILTEREFGLAYAFADRLINKSQWAREKFKEDLSSEE